MIELLYDHTGAKVYITEPLEELIVYEEGTDNILFYCVFYERVRDEMHNSFPKVADDKKFLDVVGETIIYFYQGIKCLQALHKVGVAFSDFKHQNLLVTFLSKELKFGDFGMAF